MKLVKPSFLILEQSSGLEGIYKQIELAGKTCYKSENTITEDSAKGFVDRMVKSQHYAMLEHGTVYLAIPVDVINSGFIGRETDTLLENPYVKSVLKPGFWYFSTNYRVIIENDLLRVLDYLCDPTEHHERRVTVKYVASIHFYKDCTRHRVFSWAIESTRYCNYIKNKFGHSVSFIYPCWLKEKEVEEFEQDLKTIEGIYFKWIEKGWQAQQAATFLPQATKAEVIMTGFTSDFKHFFDLRALGTTGAPHPQVKELAEPLMNEFKNRKFI